MRINSDPQVSGGQPHLSGHRLSVGTAVVHIKEKGLANFFNIYCIGLDMNRELIGLRIAFDYCRNQQCADARCPPCLKCSRSVNPSAPGDLSTVARELYVKYFVKRPGDIKV